MVELKNAKAAADKDANDASTSLAFKDNEIEELQGKIQALHKESAQFSGLRCFTFEISCLALKTLKVYHCSIIVFFFFL